ncbi:MAG: hypothetical protein LH614_17620 [Pyrinomonadaceae bacterium]|nr:hypothetical protein [Pyrinomonadaceae bacterium]
MSNKLRRFETLLPLQFNDGREVPPDWLAEAVLEIVERFNAASYETQKVEGHWRHQGILYRDNLVKIVIDAADEKPTASGCANTKRVGGRNSTNLSYGWSVTQ